MAATDRRRPDMADTGRPNVGVALPTGGGGGEAVPTGHTDPTRCDRFATFAECPHCGGAMAPEHAHFRCASCGWRDSCCD